MKIQLKHSNVLDGSSAKEPTSEQMEYGEVAVNYNSTDPALFIKGADNSIIRIAGRNAVGNTLPGYPDLADGQGASLDERYVFKQGDNMTGDLTLGTDQITLNATDGSATFAGGDITLESTGVIKPAGGVQFNDGSVQTTSATLPTGTVTMFAGSVPPSGWLECNGQSTASHPALAAVVGGNVPDMRGVFARGWDNGRGTDPGRSLGSYQDDEYGSHNHTASDSGHAHGYTLRAQRDFTVNGDNNNNAGANQISNTTSTGYANITVNYSGGTETRPKNIAFMYIIKT